MLEKFLTVEEYLKQGYNEDEAQILVLQELKEKFDSTADTHNSHSLLVRERRQLCCLSVFKLRR